MLEGWLSSDYESYFEPGPESVPESELASMPVSASCSMPVPMPHYTPVPVPRRMPMLEPKPVPQPTQVSALGSNIGFIPNSESVHETALIPIPKPALMPVAEPTLMPVMPPPSCSTERAAPGSDVIKGRQVTAIRKNQLVGLLKTSTRFSLSESLCVNVTLCSV